MATKIMREADILVGLADQFTAISVSLYDYRSRTALSARDERIIRDEGELPLDTLANMLRGRAVEEVAKAASEQITDIQAALSKAKATVEQIASVKEAIAVVADVISLAGALLSRQPKAILEALKPFRERRRNGRAAAALAATAAPGP